MPALRTGYVPFSVGMMQRVKTPTSGRLCMPEDGSNFGGGETPKMDQPNQLGDTPTIPTSAVNSQGASRRAFLTAAVIGSAAVAAAGSAGAAALNLTVKKPGAILRFPNV